MTDRDEEILKMPLDEEELNEASGGVCFLFGAGGKGGCTESFYVKKCDATVESHSHCHRHDFCHTGKHIKYDERKFSKEDPTGRT